MPQMAIGSSAPSSSSPTRSMKCILELFSALFDLQFDRFGYAVAASLGSYGGGVM